MTDKIYYFPNSIGNLLMLNRNFNVRNFGLGSRDPVMAAKNALKENGSSFSSIDTNTDRFRPYANYMREEHGIKDLRWYEQSHVIQYGEMLCSKVESGKISIATAHNRLSAINVIMQQARQDKELWISPVELLGKRSGVRTISRALTEKQLEQQSKYLLLQNHGTHLKIAHTLTYRFGLRFEEASKFDANKALQQALQSKSIKITYGTKGGRPRILQNLSSDQISILKEAAKIQGKNRSLIPKEMNYKTWRNHAYSSLKKAPHKGWHPGRHSFANTRYNEITHLKTPLQSGLQHGSQHHKYIAKTLNVTLQEAKEIDKKARLQIANQLGHNRIEITNAYLG